MKIVLFDYYLDEWHANNYQRFFDLLKQDIHITGAYALIDAPDGLTNEEWARKQGVKLFDDPFCAAKDCDGIMVLSPDNPEQHKKLCEAAFSCGKPVYIDKPFSLSRAEAEEIFALADKAGISCFSSSALRYAAELQTFAEEGKITRIESQGLGRVDLYAVHQLENIVHLFGCKALNVTMTGKGKYEIAFETGIAALDFNEDDFSLTVFSGEKIYEFPRLTSYFEILSGKVAEFFRTKKAPVDRKETIRIAAVTEAMLLCKNIGDTVNVGEN